MTKGPLGRLSVLSTIFNGRDINPGSHPDIKMGLARVSRVQMQIWQHGYFFHALFRYKKSKKPT